MKKIILLITLLFTTFTQAIAKDEFLTKSSRYLNYIQKKYADQSELYPIILIDRDEINWEFSQKNLFGDDKETERLIFITNYFKLKLNIDISKVTASNLDIYLTKIKNSAVAVPFTTSYSAKDPYDFCAVFSSDSNSNQRLETERLLGLNTPGAYENLSYEQLLLRPRYQDLRKFSLLHELSHCLDKEFLPSARLYSDDPHGVHESESFAETNALFLAQKEGIHNFANIRSKMRSLYSREMGNFFINNPNIGFGDPLLEYGGIIYNLAPVLNEGERIIREQRIDFENATLEELNDISVETVSNYSLQARAFSSVYMFLKNGEEKTVEIYQNYEQTMPDLFEGVLDSLKKYIAQYSSIIKDSFDLSLTPTLVTEELLEFKLEAFCEAFLDNDRSAFYKTLQLYRDDLQEEKGTPEQQRQRQTELMNIFETVAKSCPSN